MTSPGSAADFRAGGTRRSRMPILDRASLWVTPLVKATGLRTVKLLLGDGNATIAQRFRMDRLLDDALIEPLAAHCRVQHVARQEVDEIHGPFP